MRPAALTMAVDLASSPADPAPAAAGEAPRPPRESLPRSDEAALVGQLARGEAGAFERLVSEHHRAVARAAHRLLGWSRREDVEDVVQEVFVAALGALPRFRGESSLRTWLTALTVNACRKQRRRAWLRRVLRRDLVTPAAPPADTAAADAERDAVVRAAVRALPAKYREVVVLRYLEELDVPDVAAALRISRGAVDVRLHRAREMLRERLGALVQ